MTIGNSEARRQVFDPSWEATAETAAGRQATERLLAVIAGIVAVLMGLTPPLGNFARNYQSEVAALRAEAQVNARVVSEIVGADGKLSEQERTRLERLLFQSPVNRVPEQRVVQDATGAVMAQVRDPLSAPILSETAQVYEGGRKIGSLSISRSLRPALEHALLLAALFIPLAGAAFFCLYVLPVRRLRKAADLLVIERRHSTEIEQTLDAAALREAQDHKKAIEEKARQQATLSALINSSPDLIYYKDPQGTYLGCNEAFARWLGTTVEGVCGKKDGDLMEPHRAAVLRERDQELLRELKPVTREERIEVDGRRVLLEAIRAPYWDSEGRLIGSMGIGRDITQRKQAEAVTRAAKEAAEAATRMKSDFIANMSHEIRTPMNAVLGLSHLVLNMQLTGRQRDFVQKIQNSAQHLVGIINQILDFSKIEAGKLELEQQDFELETLLGTVTDFIGEKCRAKGLELVLSIAPEVPRHLAGDGLRLSQVLINLANNAVKFTDQGEIVISADVLKITGGNALMRFSVRDTGIGMTPQQVGRLFQSFQQADTSTSRRYGGTGLGLVISKRLAALMGGEIGVESTSGEGSTFWFTALVGVHARAPVEQSVAALRARCVPVADDNDVALKIEALQSRPATALTASTPPTSSALDLGEIRGARVLLVEDNDINQIVAAEILTDAGLAVDIAADGRIALEMVQAQPYDIVLMDVQMPVMDGIQATAEIRKLGRFGRLPIVAMTANAMEQDRERCLAAGMNDFVGKPFEPEDLRRALLRWTLRQAAEADVA